jgi:hypothetical protein
LRQARSGKRWGPPVCSAVLFFRHWLGSARDAARHCRSRHLLRLAARPKTARTPRGRRGHRVRGLWCFERLIRVGHRDRLAERRIPSSAPGRPAMWSLGKRLPATARLLPGRWALRRPGLIARQGDARRAGQRLASHLGAVQRPNARLDPSVVRGFVRLYARPVGAAQCNGGKVTQARDLTSKLANDDRAKYGRGFTVLRACRPRPPVRRRSGPHRLHSDGLRPRKWSTPTATS